MHRTKTLLAFLPVFLYQGVLAGVTGKIAGQITAAGTHAPLPGTNILLVGTSLGAATDEKGYFVILNVHPGQYDVRATLIGYADYLTRQVRVEIDRTTVVNCSMQVEVLAGDQVQVTAPRKMIREDVAATQKSIRTSQIESLPASGVLDVVALEVGITSDFEIRGGGADEAILMVDGITLRDERTNRPATNLPLSAIQEIVVQTGGFRAEYHNVRSGVINVVTREGDPATYAGTFSLRYSPPAAKHFGPSPYAGNSFWMRPYLDSAVCWTGTENGAWDLYTQRQYPSFKGWNAIAAATLTDDDPANDLTPSAAKRVYEWEHRKLGEIQVPDRNLDFGFGGPVPLIGKSLGNLRFYLSHRSVQDMYLMQLATNGVTDRTWMLKLTSDLSPATKLSVMGFNSDLRATTLSRSGGTAIMDDVWDVAASIDRTGFTIPWRIYTNIYWSVTNYTYRTLTAKLTHVFNPRSFYELQLKSEGKSYHTAPGRSRDTTRIHEIMPGYFVDEAPFGFEEKSVFGIDGMCMGGPVSTSRDFSRFRTLTVKFDYTSQVNFRNQIGTGFELVYDRFDMEFGMENKALPAGNFMNRFDRNPYRASLYLQDKIEYEGFISTLGLVTEYINSNGNWYGVDVFNRGFFSSNYQEEYEDSLKHQKSSARLFVSPRLGVSHPITEHSKLYFNYGHYLQLPTSENLYRVQRTPAGQVDYLGDPTLPLARTIAYELGYDQSLFQDYLLHLAAYYRNIDNQEDWTRYISVDGKVNYQQLTADSYEDIRGFEIDISKVYGRWITGNLNYEYRVGTSGYFGVKSYYENPYDQREYLRLNPYQSKPVPRPRVKGNISLHSPEDFGWKLGSQRPLAGWTLNFSGGWTAGYWMTWNPNNLPGIEYNLQWSDNYRVDARIFKIFRFKNVQVKLFADIYNLFNLKTLSGESFYDLDDYHYYMYSLHLSGAVAARLGSIQQPYPNIPGDDAPGDYRPAGIEYVPMEYRHRIDFGMDVGREGVIYYNAADREYWKYSAGDWLREDPERVDYVLDNKAYIDMPNQTYFSFLNPRDIFLGITVSFDLR